MAIWLKGSLDLLWSYVYMTSTVFLPICMIQISKKRAKFSRGAFILTLRLNTSVVLIEGKEQSLSNTH